MSIELSRGINSSGTLLKTVAVSSAEEIEIQNKAIYLLAYIGEGSSPASSQASSSIFTPGNIEDEREKIGDIARSRFELDIDDISIIPTDSSEEDMCVGGDMSLQLSPDPSAKTYKKMGDASECSKNVTFSTQEVVAPPKDGAQKSVCCTVS